MQQASSPNSEVSDRVGYLQARLRMPGKSAKRQPCGDRWSTFQLSKCLKNGKWLPISIITFFGSGRKFGYRLWEGGTQLHYQKQQRLASFSLRLSAIVKIFPVNKPLAITLYWTAPMKRFHRSSQHLRAMLYTTAKSQKGDEACLGESTVGNLSC